MIFSAQLLILTLYAIWRLESYTLDGLTFHERSQRSSVSAEIERRAAVGGAPFASKLFDRLLGKYVGVIPSPTLPKK